MSTYATPISIDSGVTARLLNPYNYTRRLSIGTRGTLIRLRAYSSNLHLVLSRLDMRQRPTKYTRESREALWNWIIRARLFHVQFRLPLIS